MPSNFGQQAATVATMGAVSLSALYAGWRWYRRSRGEDSPLTDQKLAKDVSSSFSGGGQKATDSGGSWTGMVTKNDKEEAELEQESKALTVLEAELRSAEARVETAETRYNLARKQVAKELAKPLAEEKPGESKGQVVDDKDLGIDAADAVEIDARAQKGSRGAKNTGAMTDKQVSSQRWLANRAAERRVRDATKNARERLRRNARDRRLEAHVSEPLQGDTEQAPEAEAKQPAAAVKPATQSGDLGLHEAMAIKEGAQGVAERLKKHPDAAGRRASLVKVLIGARENVYTFELSDVVADLRERGLVEASLAEDVLKHLKEESAKSAKSAAVKPEDWLAHAQKISNNEPLDKPLKEAETTYLKWLEEKRINSAEAELKDAESKLQAALSQAVARYPKVCDDEPSAPPSPDRRAGAEPEVDLDEAQRLEELHGSNPASCGSKNTSAMSKKAVSRDRWEAERGHENKARERQVKSRDTGRAEARDRKMGAAAPGED